MALHITILSYIPTSYVLTMLQIIAIITTILYLFLVSTCCLFLLIVIYECISPFLQAVHMEHGTFGNEKTMEVLLYCYYFIIITTDAVVMVVDGVL